MGKALCDIKINNVSILSLTPKNPFEINENTLAVMCRNRYESSGCVVDVLHIHAIAYLFK